VLEVADDVDMYVGDGAWCIVVVLVSPRRLYLACM